MKTEPAYTDLSRHFFDFTYQHYLTSQKKQDEQLSSSATESETSNPRKKIRGPDKSISSIRRQFSVQKRQRAREWLISRTASNPS